MLEGELSLKNTGTSTSTLPYPNLAVLQFFSFSVYKVNEPHKWPKQFDKGHIAAVYGWFNRTGQVAPMCIPSSTPQSASVPYQCCPCWVSKYVNPRTRPGMSWVSHFSSLKLPFHVWGSTPHGSFGQPSPHPNGISIGSAICAWAKDHETDRQTTLLHL